MKKLIRITSFVVLMATVTLSITSAQNVSSVPGNGWWSGEMIQNIGASDANVIVKAYDAASSATYTTFKTIPPDGAQNFIPSDLSGLPDGFQGTMIAYADQPIRAIVNLANRPAGDFGVPGGAAAAQYQAVDSSAVATTLYFPMVKHNRYDKTTSFYIQNAGTITATATCIFKMDDGGVYTYTTPSISPHRMVVVTPGDADVPSTNDNRQNIGGLVVSSAQPLAGVVMEYFSAENPATLLQGTRSFTAQDFDTKLYAPTIKQLRYNRFTGIQVQNVDSVPITVTVTLVGSRGDCAGQTFVLSKPDLAPGRSHTFNQLFGQDGQMVDNCAASATIEGTGNVVATVNESFVNDQVPPGEQQASTTYSAFPDKFVSTQVSVPMYKENRYNKYTGLMIQNVGPITATHVIIRFVGSAGPATGNTYTTLPQTIPPGASIELSKISERPTLWTGTGFTPPANSTFGVTVVADQPVVALANEAVYDTATLVQDKNNYEGFNLP
jgi:hypothetical protein